MHKAIKSKIKSTMCHFNELCIMEIPKGGRVDPWIPAASEGESRVCIVLRAEVKSPLARQKNNIKTNLMTTSTVSAYININIKRLTISNPHINTHTFIRGGVLSPLQFSTHHHSTANHLLRNTCYLLQSYSPLRWRLFFLSMCHLGGLPRCIVLHLKIQMGCKHLLQGRDYHYQHHMSQNNQQNQIQHL